ncbi:bifunctional diguanylate cyclase/phosphodiesterase [Desulfopila aestuarii]|uniref:Diguanylate cyclase (GGDEF) domain-containing protein n=1 Tax=Desulfopila aestuarii DSM 18488 TaxID=1121416 RepID=A0A1M7XVD8_9BACT|nr:EAL domain-containing protein [Desulfopila aestuarii]SHO42522.1 diguanylate cyclase (GGDEF) domain-containing protein [Desulfopila aestuarii DSM 18488]
MTLYRQLLIFTVILFVALFAGIWVEKLHSTRSFLVTQLESHAQDTATSLGLSLSPVMVDNDIATVDTMINAVFDRGYYRVISFKDMEGEVITERILKVEIAGVPDWFVNLVPIKSPNAESLVMAGWNQAGKLYVESHPGFAYQTMWEAMVRISIYFLLSVSTVLLLGGLGLRMLLKPLKQVELQAEAICRREYHIQDKLPKTRELRQVVNSMNRMTNQVREMFASQSKIAENLRRKAYSDQVTGLGNRRYLSAQVEARLEAAQGVARGALLIVQLENLKKINDFDGFAAGDTLLKKVADILKQETQVIDDVALARLTGGDFGIFISAIDPADVNSVAESISRNIRKLAIEVDSQVENIAHVGGVTYDYVPTLSKLLSEADNALQGARRKGANQWLVAELSSQEDQTVKGKIWWKETLEDVLAKDDIFLYGQPVVSSADHSRVLHQELLSRIAMQSGEIVSAGVFVPLAERLQLVSKLDMVVLAKVFEQKEKMATLKSIAVNISPSSLGDSLFVKWILAQLQRLPGNAPHIIFEFSEYGAVQYIDLVKDFSREVQGLGHGIGLDHFGQSFANFGYLKSLRPEYVKIDRAFTKELESDQGDSEFFIGALCGVAHSLDIRVIAEGVERDDQVAMLLELNIDALQGYLFGQPQQV